MPTADCSRQHDVTADAPVNNSPTKTGGAKQGSEVTQKNHSGGSENNPVTQTANQPDYADKTPNEHEGDLARKSTSPEAKSSPSKSIGSGQKSIESEKEGDVVVNGQTNDKWVHDQRDQEQREGTKSASPTVYTLRNEAEIVNISTTEQTALAEKDEEEEEESEREDEEEEEFEGETETESGEEEEEEEEEQEEEDIMDTGGGDSGVVLNQEGEQTKSETQETRSPEPKVPNSPSKKRKARGPSQNTLDLQRAATSVHYMHDNVEDLFDRVKIILGEYHTELSAKTLNEFVLEKEDFHDNFVAISNIYSECETVTSSINKQLKELRQTTTEIYRLINRKFREEDLATWVDQTEDAEKEQDRLREERIAQEKAVLAKAAEARAAFAKASTGVSETHEIVAQVEAEAAEAEVTAKKARANADDAIKIAKEAKIAAEEKRKVEEEARKKAEERAKIRAEEERKKREEEEKRLEEEAKKRGTSVDDERQRAMDEKAIREAERKNPKNWPRYIFSIEGGDFDPGVGCIIRAIDGSISRDDVTVQRMDQLTGVLSLYENEELISNIVHVQPVDKEKTFTFEESFSMAIPHCAPRSGIGREPVIKMLQPNGRWIDLPTNDVFFEDIKELRFVEARLKRFGTFAVIYRIRRDNLMFTKRGGKVTSTVDSRVTFISKPLGFKFNTNFTLEVQSVDLSLVSDLRQRKSECSTLLASSPIIKMGIANKKFPKPIAVTLPVPPNPSRLKRPGTSINREPTVVKTESRPATAKPGVAFTKKEEDTQVDDLHLIQRLSDGTWVKVIDVTLVQAKNKDVVSFDMQQSYERFFILRTKLDVPTAQVEQIALSVTETITQRTIQFFLRQHNDDLNKTVISCATVSRLDRNLGKMEDEGYEEGPVPSKPTFVKEGQIMDLKFRGNLIPETDDYRKQFVFNSHIPCRVDFTVKTIDTFAQKGFDSYRGFAQLFTQGLVPRTLLPTDDSRETKSWNQQKAQPRVVMEIGEVLVAELLMTVPKPDPEAPKPLITAPLSSSSEGPVDKDVLYHISQELGDEWKRLAQYLNVKRTRLQAILRQNVSKENTNKIYDMLATWSKRLPRAADRVEILSHGLMSCGRRDLAVELRERREEFKRQRAVSARDSYLRKAFVKIARDQTVIGNWKHLGRKLGLSESEMVEIERDRPTSQDRCYSSLQRWRERSGDEATITTLSQKLRFCRHKALARDIETIA